MVVATRPAQGLRMCVKWSLDSIEWVGSSHRGLVQGSNCVLALVAISPEEPSLRLLEMA